MNWDAPIVVFMLFLIRLALPIAILLGLGVLYERWLVRQHEAQTDSQEAVPQFRQVQTAVSAMGPQGYSAEAVPCWKIKGCSPEARAKCPAAQRPGVPCWLTMQLVEGSLPENCIECQVFKDSTPQYVAS